MPLALGISGNPLTFLGPVRRCTPARDDLQNILDDVARHAAVDGRVPKQRPEIERRSQDIKHQLVVEARARFAAEPGSIQRAPHGCAPASKNFVPDGMRELPIVCHVCHQAGQRLPERAGERAP